jgi:pimeloyl-ACP methyl ester carboxylesterase
LRDDRRHCDIGVTSFVLIHGGCHGAWCWEPVIERLAARGHDATAIDLPGRGATAGRLATVTLEESVEEVADAVAAAGVPILVAHSMGGVPCSAFAERHPGAIRGLVYLNALIPRDGQAGLPLLVDEAGPDCALSDADAVRVSQDGASVTVPPELALEAFYGRCAADVAAAAVDRLCPEPLAPLMTPISLTGRSTQTRKTYIGATGDRAVPPAFARRMADAAGADYLTIDADHSPFFSAPDSLVDMLHVCSATAPGVPGAS